MPQPLVTLTLCETERMAALEVALEYAINTADGVNYTYRAAPIVDDPKMDAARKLLPAVKWAWVSKRD